MSTFESLLARNEGLGQLFYQQMLEDPDAIAIVDGDYSLTYASLHAQATHLAQRLDQNDFVHEEPVGIVVQHGILDAVAQVAIIYAGGTCVTLDPALPNQQIERRLNRLRARYILVDTPNKSRGLPFSQIEVEDLPISTELIPTDSPYPVNLSLEHRSHLIHTSGTTSESKAVQIVGRSIVHVANYAPFEPVVKTDVVAHGNSTSFDVALFDIWAPLVQGASIAVLSKATLLDLSAFEAAIDRYKISVMAITAPLVNLAATTRPGMFSSMRVVLMGGEAVNIPAMRKIFEAGPPVHMVNAYGPTECCVYCLARKITLEDLDTGAVSIGKAIGNNIATVCDEMGKPVPDGEEGELLVGGPGVSPGYVNLPGKNAASFIEVPDLVDANGTPYHMYRTGDLVKRRPDGQYDFVGRFDHQVKIRGYRVELGAIETVLMDTGYFSEGVVMKVDSKAEGAGSALVAFAVLAPTAPPSAVTDATAALTAALPHYMIPNIHIVESIPLTNHAKVDRKQLADWCLQRQEKNMCAMQDKVPSEGASTRDQLGALWATILATPVREYSDNDDFFGLGGTSLQASLLISLIRRTFNTEVSLLALYDNSTLGQLAHIVDRNQGGALATVQNLREMWIADTMIGDALETPVGPVVDWRRDTEGRVFLTGATGFVGAFLLSDMLKMPGIHQVGCLVRAPDEATGVRRLRHALEKYNLWREEYLPKLLPLCGKLEDPWLGLGEQRFREIADWASVIFHLGALVNYTQPYSWHRPANIEGTVNVVRLACTGRSKALHYCSSISCFGPTGIINGTKVVHEDGALMPHLNALPYDHGYAQSQWVAEELLRRLIHRRFPIAVYRPGFITGHSETGACNPDDFFSRLIRACSSIGCYPGLPNQRKEFVPIDYVTSTMIHIASSSLSLGHAFHIVPPTREESPEMNDTMSLIGELTGTSIQPVSYREWIEQLSSTKDLSLQPLLPMLAEVVIDGMTRWEMYENMPTYENTNTLRALASCPDLPKFPMVDEALLRKYLDYLADH
ncbi:hypothetical protein BBP40_009478 [Aspergillus hancockii]|uniref:Non-canonical nonribosomal peptide synthetase hkm10 n=1 Tax=Aspergillus hancockii TaxID=1873369 RepID=HKM10_ASPHA|nr:RecName: Full=Non-canonical nonribosomal peptide synthetase hkm10; AltName: Full=Hancockiamides biosynthesis cluster protein 10 [Aspergillus hancockii]KAF7597140.1 hypothetical protein BBP40_009478 [Aspergillus hancockii]